MTPEALMRANVIYANGLMRRRLGANPRVETGFNASTLGKLVVARSAKALNLQKPNPRILPTSFRLDGHHPGNLLAP
jgi:hypothetical protein